MSKQRSKFQSFLSPVGRFMNGVATANRASEIASTPESYFTARGTSRDQALRDLFDLS